MWTLMALMVNCHVVKGTAQPRDFMPFSSQRSAVQSLADMKEKYPNL